MKLKSLLVIIAGALGVLAVFLPWYQESISMFGVSASASANGFTGEWTVFGTLSLLSAIATIVIAGINYNKQLPKWGKITNTILGVVLCGVALIVIAGLGSLGASAAFGLYLLLIAGIAVIVLDWVKISATLGGETKKAKSSTKKED